MVSDSAAEQTKAEKMNAQTKPIEFLDVRNVACPPALWVLIPVMKRAGDGEVIQILTTDPHDKEDIAQWVRKVGSGFVNAVSEKEYDRIIVRKRKAE
ncbi:MAG: sulfurtransferase TusA family protein [Thaumarchaeota archaeon]|nr:sulfurtransferase TusA family protein [Nitrososphaerota archaeon]MCL5066981.1 sulfurtransferase TusA family protein [Nitrososphaerota archaeon]